MHGKWTLVLSALGILVASSLQAQTAQTFSIQGSFLGASVGGDFFEHFEVDPGGGFELQARWNPSAFSIGGGFQSTFHTSSLVIGEEAVDVDFTFTGFFVEPRYVVFVGSERVAPYVSARVMSLVATLEAPEFDTEEDVDAIAWGAGGGLLFALGSRLNLDVGATWGQMTFKFDDPEFEDETGSSGVYRIGIAYGL